MGVEDAATAGRLLAFRVGEGRFAVALESVLGVQDPAQTAAGDGAAVMFRGRRLAALDARLLGWGGCRDVVGLGAAVVVAVSGAEAAALIVDSVEGIVAGAAVQPLPGLVAPFVRGMFRGIAPRAEGGRLVVDPAAVAAGAGKTAADGGRGEAGEG